MRNLCHATSSCDEYPAFIRTENRIEFPLLLVRRRDDGTRGVSGIASEKPLELADVSDDLWTEFRSKINATVDTCPFSYGSIVLFLGLWFFIVATGVIMAFGAVGPSVYFWDAFWKCQSKHHLYHDPYTYEFCAKYSGWGSACLFSFFTVFSGGLCAYAYRESRRLKRWRREVEPQLEAICKEYTSLFERYGYFVEMIDWRIVFRDFVSDGDGIVISTPKVMVVSTKRQAFAPESRGTV